MVTGDLETTNLLLGILAAVSVLEALVLIGAAVIGYRMYMRAMATIRDLEKRQVEPLAAKAHQILDDVKGITERVREETDRVDQALRGTFDRVDETAEVLRAQVRSKTSRAVGFIRGIRAVIETFLAGGSGRPSEATGKA